MMYPRHVATPSALGRSRILTCPEPADCHASGRVVAAAADPSGSRRATSTRMSRRSAYVFAMLLLSIASAMFVIPVGYAEAALLGDEVLLGFGDSYVSDTGESRRHSGVDLGMKSGSDVTSPVQGKVSFSGKVPTSEIKGSPTTIAVSVDMGDGRVVTVMPLSSAAVSEGDSVKAGQVLGTLAATGDSSTQAPHVHVSLRVNGKYTDPSSLLGIASRLVDAGEDTEVSSQSANAVAVSVDSWDFALPSAATAMAESYAASTGEASGSSAVADVVEEATELGTISSGAISSGEAVIGESAAGQAVSEDASSGGFLARVFGSLGATLSDLGVAGVFVIVAALALPGALGVIAMLRAVRKRVRMETASLKGAAERL